MLILPPTGETMGPNHLRIGFHQLNTLIVCFALLVQEYHPVQAFTPCRFQRSGLSKAVGTKGSSSSAMYDAFGEAAATSLLEKAGGILYRTSVVSKDEYAAIGQDVAAFSTKLQEETSSTVAQFRMGTCLPQNSATVHIFQNGGLCRLVKQVAGPDYELSSQIPVEMRVYEKPGACMAWHVDDILYDPPQLEVVWTLENNSDCVTKWKEPDKGIRSVETERNSVILLQAGGPSHCVTSLKRGQRTIVKCAFVRKDATYREGTHTDQFGPAKQKKGRRRKR